MKLSNGEVVAFEQGSISGIGQIIGLGSGGLFWSGYGYIVKILSSNIDKTVYPYDAICMSEIFLTTVTVEV